MSRRALAAALLAAGLAAALAAQGDGQAASSTPQYVDEGDFFGNGGAEANTEVKSDYQEHFTKQEPIRFGGSFSFVSKVGMNYYRDFGGWDPGYVFDLNSVDKAESSSLDLESTLYFTARTSSTLRFFGKGKVTYPIGAAAATLAAGQTPGLPNFQLWELFTDIAVSDRVFVRAGKQGVKWGADPYAFWSPADVISLSAIDITKRGQDREGPLAIKTNIGFGDNNLDIYCIAPANATVASVADLAYAARATFLVGNWQLGVGALHQKQQDWNFVATASGSIWKLNVFGEAKVNRTAYGLYFVNGVPVNARSDWFFSGTAGVGYSNSDIYLDSVLVQYYFNGAGFSQAPGRQLLAAEAVLLMQTAWPGMHYLAVSAQESFAKDSKVHVVLTWLGNLSDGSGFVWPAVNFDLTNDISLGLNAYFYYGGENSQFRGLTTVEGIVYHQPRCYLGFSLNLGVGNF